MIALALRSLWSRRLSVGLTVLTLALSVALFLTVERLRQSARDGFDGTVSGVDVLVGARSGDLSLLLYTVFQLGDAAPSMRWSSFEAIAADERVEWAVPLSLGDSHRGYRVVATTDLYFEQVRTGRNRPLTFAQDNGQRIGGFGVVIGASLAQALDYGLGSKVVVQHGLASAGNGAHDDLPFTVTGVLQPTGTPIDYSLFVSVEAFEAVHVGWTPAGARGEGVSADVDLTGGDFEPKIITAVLVGLASKRRIFQFKSDIQNSDDEPLTAVLPGVTLSQLWVLVGSAERALQILSVLIIAVALIGLVTLLIATLDARRREIAIYRALGAPPMVVAALLVVEAFLIGLSAAALGLVLAIGGTLVASGVLSTYLRLDFGALDLSAEQALALVAFVLVSALAGLIPAVLAYQKSVQDGMRPRN